LTAGRRAFAWLLLGVAAFVVYGSLVPFQFRALALPDAVDSFHAALTAGVKIDSRSDSVANVMLGVSIGFALLGLVSVDRNWPREKTVLFALLLLPVCGLFSAGVEFSQLFTVSRVCSASDIVAQVLGTIAGMVAWVLWGQQLTDRTLATINRADLNVASRLLIAYVALLAFIQTLPFDVSASPVDLYRKFRDGGVKFVPFGEFDGMTDAQRWGHIAKLVKLAGLYFPVGLLAARLKGRVERWSILPVAFAAIGLGICLESLQLVVRSRTPSVTDALVGAFAAMAGWYAARVHHEGLGLLFAVCWGIVWLAGMTPVTQPPPGTAKLETPRPFDWMPGMPLESGDPLNALEEMLTKLLLFGLVGVLVAAWRLPPRTRRAAGGSLSVAVAIATVLGLLAGGFIEYSQRWYDTHTPCITDALLGGFGAAIGVLVASRLRTLTPKTPPQPLPQGERG
jgi:VanZ family protein